MAFSDKSGISVASGFKLQAKALLDVREVVDTIDERDELVTLNAATAGLKVFVTATNTLYIYTGDGWSSITTAASTGGVGSSDSLVYMQDGQLVESTATVGSDIVPIYLNTGTITESTGTVGTSINPIYLNAGTITASDATVGSGIIPTYLNAGVITESTGTVGSSIVPMYLKEGTFTASTETVGTPIKPIYLNSGTLTASTSTVGSSIKPIYLNEGVITASTSTVGSSINPTYLSSGTITASTETVGSATNPIYLQAGTLTACTGILSVSVSTANTEDSTTYYMPFTSSADGDLTLYQNNGIRYQSVEGTSDDLGYGMLILGNGVSEGTSGNKYGSIRIYSTNGYYYTISGGTDNAISANVTLYMPTPSSDGYMVATETTDQVGSGTKMIYISDKGIVTESTSTVGSGINPIYMNNGELVASNSEVGSSINPVYLTKGTITASSETIGSGIVPTYLSNGTVTASTSTVGTSTNPVYLKDGALTAITGTVGSGVKPIYLSSGNLTVSSSTVGSGINPTYLSSGTITASTSTIGSDIIPMYLNAGTLTASNATVGSASAPIWLSAGTLTACTSINTTSSNVEFTETNPSTQTDYAILFRASETTVGYNDGGSYTTKEGTTSSLGYGIIELGNSTVTGADGNKYGGIHVYGTNSFKWNISGSNTTSIIDDRELYLPNVEGDGWVVGTQQRDAVGDQITPVYVNDSGVVTEFNTTVGSSIVPMYMNEGELTASTSTVGSSIVPIYLNNGTITASTETVGSSIKPIYLNKGTLTVSTSTVGSGITPIYLNSGTLTASSVTVGSAINPIYLSGGTITRSTETVGSVVRPIYLYGGDLTETTETVGSGTNLMYMNAGDLTASTETVGGTQKAIYMKDGVLTEIDSSTVYTSQNPSTATVGGVEKGYTAPDDGIELLDLVYDILHPYVAPSLTAAVKPTASGTYEIGTTQTVTGFTVTITLGSESITSIYVVTTSATSTKLVEANSGSAGANTLSVTLSVTATTTWRAYIVDAKGYSYYANTGTYTFVYAMYYGPLASGTTPTATNVAALTKLIKSKGSQSVYYTCDNQHMVFAYPSSYGNIAKILDANSFDVTTTFTKYSITINSVSYYAYENNASTVSSFKMTFSW